MVPYIAKEEEKMEEETQKLLGRLNGAKIEPGTFCISAQCNRVAVEDGHTESVSVKLEDESHAVRDCGSVERVSLPNRKNCACPAHPEQPVVYLEAVDRPQPRLDVDRGAGMTTTVGRLRPCKVLDWKFTVLSHNTIRGAAGAALLNAEFLKGPRLLWDDTARPRPMIVMKFGGTSVEDAKAIDRTAAIVKRAAADEARSWW